MENVLSFLDLDLFAALVSKVHIVFSDAAVCTHLVGCD